MSKSVSSVAGLTCELISMLELQKKFLFITEMVATRTHIFFCEAPKVKTGRDSYSQVITFTTQ